MTRQNEITIGFIGGGNMAAALIGGLLNQSFDAGKIIASDPSSDQREHLARRFGIQTTNDNTQAAARSAALILAVKPQVLGTVLSELRGIITSDTLVISIVAGVSSESISAGLGGHACIVRAMPNTPALIGEGATGLFATEGALAPHQQLAEALFTAVGSIVWVTAEDQLHTVTALSGSGPAYFFLLTEALEAAAVAQGLDQEVAHKLATQTALGAARLMLESEEGPATLRQRVTSPNGTTQRAIEIFEAGGLRELTDQAAAGAAARSRELAKEF